MSVQSYRDLLVWRKAIDLVVETYALTKEFPAVERRGLTSQMRRAAVSVPSNIAQGSGRLRPGTYVKHLCVARGSLMELESDLLLAPRLGYLDAAAPNRALTLCGEVGRMLMTLSRSLMQ